MTQDECKEEFLKLCKEIMKRTSEIDANTPFGENPPKWWLDMIELRTVARNAMQ